MPDVVVAENELPNPMVASSLPLNEELATTYVVQRLDR